MNELIKELCIITENGNIFDTGEYVIPLYQRAFAWEDKQIAQLVEDIGDASEDAPYYLGTLIVSREKDQYEVVDGQQRLTALYLLLNCLGEDVKNTLTFACREKSNYTLRNIKEFVQEDSGKLAADLIETSITRGLEVITEMIPKDEEKRFAFLNKLRKNLKRVVLYRIEVPKNTDLNRYFEIMNTRGEQLEQHDILKAKLMSYLPDRADQVAFAKIWEACSDMTGYVQMHFISKNNTVRDRLFECNWDKMPPEEWDRYRIAFRNISSEREGCKIQELIDPYFNKQEDDGYTDDDIRVRFESVIEFPFFLIHTLKVLIRNQNIHHMEGDDQPIIAKLMDDKKLVKTFDQVIENGITEAGRISENKSRLAQFSKDFIICLLRTRFLFDKYIIKREYANENSDGDWSLKSLHVSGRNSQKNPYYRNTWFLRFREWDTDRKNDRRTKTNIMIQSALRVSYTSPKVMHWITELMYWLSDSDRKSDDLANYYTVAEHVAQQAVKEDFFDVCKEGLFAMGVNTPHIVFNYLDYLLWNQNKKKYDAFVFEYRNSVEHWYPRNPSEGTFEQWKDGVDRFGNLCIIQRSVNSKFSNMSPEAKKSTFTEMIAKGSLKLRLMHDMTEGYDGKSASQYWKEKAFSDHEKMMIAVLKDACGIDAEFG